MEIPVRSQFDSMRWMFTVHFDVQAFFAYAYSGTPRMGVQAIFRRAQYDDQAEKLFPVLLELHGNLARPNSPGESGMPLLAVKDVPIHLLPAYADTLVNLIFDAPERYVQLLEEERAKGQGGQDVSLTLNLWALAAIVRPLAEKPSPHQARLAPGEIVRFERLETEPYPQTIRFERSFWIDRLLTGLGYRHSVLLELPLTRTPPVPDIFKQAVEALEQARKSFEHEDYRGAIKHARDVLEYLGSTGSDESKQLSVFCKEYLEPVVGETKSLAVDTSLASMRRITNAASHVNRFLADRATSVYVIETLALNLRYIATVLG